MIKCIIIEDQLPAQRILKRYIEDLGTLELVGVFSDSTLAISTLHSEKIDLMFLDIHLPKLSGIDFLKSLKNPPQVILSTAFQEFALEGYELNVVDYLLKPFSFQRFVMAVEKVKDVEQVSASSPAEKHAESPKDLFVKSGYDIIRIITSDILYVKTDSDYTEIHITEKKHLSSEPLSYWQSKLANDGFIRVHKSYMINTNKIQKISGNRVVLANGTEIPIGRAYKHDFLERIG